MYEYAPLPSQRHIRLLVLHPRCFSSTLSCDLIKVSLDDKPEFEAISYAWGDRQPQYDILLGPKKYLSIGPSLFAALQQIRFGLKRRVVWVDAICINQTDTQERSSQVKIMGDIYTAASKTLIWLGEGSDRLYRTLHILQTAEKVHGVTYLTPVLSQRGRTDESSDWVNIIGCAWDSEEALVTLKELYELPWFGRKWIIQELVMSRCPVVLLGKKEMPWQVLENFSMLMMTHQQDASLFGADGIRAKLHMSNVTTLAAMRLNRKSINVLRLLIATVSFRCTDPRDAVISLLGLVQPGQIDTDTLDSIANYEISPPDQHYRFVKFATTEFPGLQTFSLVNVSPLERRVRSWVPNLAELDFSSQLASDAPENIPGICASPKRPQELTFVDDGTLLITGRCADAIDVLASEPRKRYLGVLGGFTDDLEVVRMFAEAINGYNKWYHECLAISLDATIPANPSDVLFRDADYIHNRTELFVRTYLFDTRSDLSDSNIKEFLTTYKFVFLTARKIVGLSGEDPDFTDQLMTLEVFLEDLAKYAKQENCISDRIFCRTKQGRLGWMPLYARQGDIICVFNGAKMAHVIRPSDDGGYRLIGDCYVQGLMNGEVDEMEEVDDEFILLD